MIKKFENWEYSDFPKKGKFAVSIINDIDDDLSNMVESDSYDYLQEIIDYCQQKLNDISE